MTHRIAVFQRSGLLGGNPFGGEIRRAVAAEDLSAAYRLAHDVYVEQGYIHPDPRGIKIRLFEAFPEMATFVGEVDGEIVGVMGIVPDSANGGLPSDKAFRPELDALRARGLSLGEVTNLALKPAYRRTSLFFDLARACFAQATLWGTDQVFVSICPKHSRFFRDVLHFAPYGDERSYSTEVEDIVVGMAMDCRTIERQLIETDRLLGESAFMHDSFYAGNPFHVKCGGWSREARRAFSDANLLRELFVNSSSLLGKCSREELDTIRGWWGEELFAAVRQGQRPHARPEAQPHAAPAIGWA